MAKVRLDFTPPQQPDIAKLHIYESATREGTYNPIEVVTDIGTYPNYLSYYSTAAASSATGWFAIAWETTAGITGNLSAPMQGGTMSLVGQIVDRVLLRNPSLSEIIVTQEAEEAVKLYYKTEDPYGIDVTAPVGNIMTGLVYLTMARTMVFDMVAGGSSSGWTAGLVSMKAGTGTSNKDGIEWLINWANKFLGLNLSYVMLLEEIDVTGLNTTSSINYDQSRQAVTINYE